MPLSRPLRLGLAFALAGLGGVVLAQDSGGGGRTSYEVGGVQVDVTGASGAAAREGGWRLAERKGWSLLAQRLTGKPATLSDSALDNIVTGIMVEHEDIGANRYIARLGVLFDRAQASALLGVTDQFRRSPPMLVVPLFRTGGVDRVFERENPWEKAWERFRSGGSTVDYVRTMGTGPDRLLLNAGQVDRNGRGWWHTILGQYRVADVLIPEVRLRRQWPGGPVIGTFIAGHGPDNVPLGQFTLRAGSDEGLDALLDEGVRRIDRMYQAALSANQLQPDRTLAAQVAGPATDAGSDDALGNDSIGNTADPDQAASSAVQVYAVQVETPTAGSVSAAESALRGMPGVRAATTSSLALGGVSVMRVTFEGDLSIFSEALRLRGWQVQQGGGVLRIRRGGAGSGSPPAGDNSPSQE